MSRSGKGMVGSSGFGEDASGWRCQFFSRWRDLTGLSPHKLDSAKVNRATSEVNACIRGSPRTKAYDSGHSKVTGCQRRRIIFLRSVAEKELSKKEEEPPYS